MHRIAIIYLLLTIALAAQVNSPEPTGELIADDAHYRISRVAIAPGAQSAVKQDGHDVVIVVLPAERLTLASSVDSPLEDLSDGQVRFLKMGSKGVMSNPTDKTGQALIVELKQHWDAEVHPCTEPKKCTRSIRAGEQEIGETKQLFGNGFVTAYRHRLVPGASLTSSYFSAKGKDHLLFIALADLRANFDGLEETLKAGQVYSSDAMEVEMNAGSSEAKWVVIRVETPKE
jgi:hypothetical protein